MIFSKLSCEEFVEILASKEPIPGGGGASALVGAIGMALGNMVGSLTVGKKKYAGVQDEILALKAKANAIQAELIDLMQKDAEVFEPLSKTYGMPSGTEDEKSEKDRLMAEALKKCCEVPLEIMKKCCEAIELQGEFAAKGTAIAISDAGCGVICCKAALQAASLNVFINTKSMTDHRLADENNKLAKEMLTVYSSLADKIFADVEARFHKE
jgi:formiminotetrahydrofolate cyclodeaminase